MIIWQLVSVYFAALCVFQTISHIFIGRTWSTALAVIPSLAITNLVASFIC